jgi:F420-non-reducing hydrogenase iron-sulfur subunit
MASASSTSEPRILIIGTPCSYPGADTAGLMKLVYPSTVYIMRVPCCSIVPISVYLRAFKRGIDGIIIASCGTDCPHEGAFDKTAERVQSLYTKMQDMGLETDRLKLTSLCTVCAPRFVELVTHMNQKLQELGPTKFRRQVATVPEETK